MKWTSTMADDPTSGGAVRRPLRTRDRAFAHRLTSWLVRAGATPNGISAAGMMFGIAAGMSFAATAQFPGAERWLWLAGAFGVQFRLLANMLDGMVALETGTDSPLGELYNEIPDRISDTAILVGLGFAAGSMPALGFAAAIAAVFTAYVRAFGASLDQGQDFSGPFAKPQRMFTATLAGLFGAIAPNTMQTFAIANGEFSVVTAVLVLIAAGTAFTALNRIWRLARKLRQTAT